VDNQSADGTVGVLERLTALSERVLLARNTGFSAAHNLAIRQTTTDFYLALNPDVVLELQGNTDSVGTDAYNLALGKRRADAVFNYMETKGIEPNRLKQVSFGERKPVATNSTDAGRAQNRRVELVIVK